MRKILAALGLWLALAGAASAQICSAVPFTFTAGTTIRSSQVNSNFSGIVSCVNAGAAPLASPAFTGTVTMQNPLGVTQGGTGAGTFTSGNLIQGSGTSALADSGLPAVSVWSTGDVKMTMKTSADAGWVLMNDGTIGDASSGGTARANADTSALFTLIWTNCANTQCPVSTGRGASAAADFAAHKTINLPLVLGRALAAAGSGSGLTSRVLGATTGAETHSISTAEMPVHNHGASGLSFSGSFSASNSVSAFFGGANAVATFAGQTCGGGVCGTDGTVTASYTPTGTVSGSIGGSTANAGSGTAMSLMQPTGFAINVEIKL